MNNQKDRLLTDEFLNSIKTKIFNPFKYSLDEEYLRNYNQLDGLREVAQAQVAKCDKEWVEKLKDIRYLAQTYQNDQIIKVINKALKGSMDGN